jgi:hypothetical protein
VRQNNTNIVSEESAVSDTCNMKKEGGDWKDERQGSKTYSYCAQSFQGPSNGTIRRQ